MVILLMDVVLSSKTVDSLALMVHLVPTPAAIVAQIRRAFSV
jgi:hypothetical protein